MDLDEAIDKKSPGLVEEEEDPEWDDVDVNQLKSDKNLIIPLISS